MKNNVLMISCHNYGLDPREDWHFKALKLAHFSPVFIGVNKERAVRPSWPEDIRHFEKISAKHFSVILNWLCKLKKPYLFLTTSKYFLKLSKDKNIHFTRTQSNFVRGKIILFIDKISSFLKRCLFNVPSLRILVLIFFVYLPDNIKIILESRKLTTIPEIIIANDLYTYLSAKYLKKKFKSVLVYDIQEFYQEADISNSFLSRRIIKLIEKRMLKISDVNLVVSSQLGTEIGKHYGFNNSILLPNAPLLEKENNNQIKLTNKRIESEFLRVYFQGNFYPGRGLEFIIRCWKNDVISNSFHLYLQGPESRYKTDLVKLADELGVLNKSVFFVEPVAPWLMRDWILINADLALIPYLGISRNNILSCPNKLGLMLSSGTPIIANSSLQFVSQILKKSKAGFLYKEDNMLSFVEKLSFFKNRESLRKYSNNAYQFYCETFNFDAYFKSVHEKYNFMLRDRELN